MMLSDINSALTASVAYSSAYSFIEFLGMIFFVIFTMSAVRNDNKKVTFWQIMKSQVKGYFASAFVGLLFMLIAMSALTAVVGDVNVAGIGSGLSASNVSGSSLTMILFAVMSGILALWVFWFVTIKSSMNYSMENNAQKPNKGIVNFSISICRELIKSQTYLFIFGGFGVWMFFISIQSLVKSNVINIPLTILMHVALSIVVAWYFLVLSEVKDTPNGDLDAV
jgi:hypothetical protein